MNGFRQMDPKELGNAMEMIGKQWMLITAKDEANHKVNAMTASWGCMGVLWNKPICVVFIRPQRYTCPLVEATDRFSIAFLEDTFRQALRLCGTESGRDGDKLSKAGLTTMEQDGVPVIREAQILLTVKKLYADTLKEAGFLDPALLANYAEQDYHRVFVCEIEQAYVKA